MRYYRRRQRSSGDPRLVARDGQKAYDLTTANPELASFRDLAFVAAATDTTVDDIAADALDDAPLIEAAFPAEARLPVEPDEVWAAGVTYEVSSDAREAESDRPEVYQDIFEAKRPELFFKATASRTVGPGDAVGVRGDSEWNVPEPELGVVLFRGEIVGFTVGDDASSRSLEGRNPLYLPQAKIYDRCCALGPCVASPETVGDPHDLEMTMTIRRGGGGGEAGDGDGDGGDANGEDGSDGPSGDENGDDGGEIVFEDATSTSKLARTCEELASYLTAHDAVPELSVLLTGTSLVPPESFTLREGDSVEIDIESIGTLRTGVVEV